MGLSRRLARYHCGALCESAQRRDQSTTSSRLEPSPSQWPSCSLDSRTSAKCSSATSPTPGPPSAVIEVEHLTRKDGHVVIDELERRKL